MNDFKKIMIPSLVLAGAVISPLVLAQGSFDGHNVNVQFEIWGSDDVSNLLGVTHELDILASDTTYPDAEDFYVFTPAIDHFNWALDFSQDTIEMTYTSIEVQDFDHQYMYSSSKGFHFQDIDGSLPDIINVTVDSSFAPFGFDPMLVTFDENNIFVNLKGSMCHIGGMASMPTCTNLNSPTGYDNQIKLVVEFAGQAAGDDVDYSRIDALFDALEVQYSEYFPNHQESSILLGYYVRYYPETDIYLGTKEGRLVVYGQQFGGLLDVGSLDFWLNDAGL